ncbi:MAG: anthranilate synthase component I [Desulfotomaculaceae bacterium]|nr:anthranilate synthase component I [Desulfotomaculaceae bacterium]
MINPVREGYLSLSKTYNLIPVSDEINADLDTPISIYKKVAPAGPAYLLESVEGGEILARYSFIGFDPFLTFISQGEESHVYGPGSKKIIPGPPLEALERVIGSYSVYQAPGLPRFFGGAVGYISYDVARFTGKIETPQGGMPGLPGCYFIFAGTVLIFDHVKRALTVVVNSLPGADPGGAYDLARERIKKIVWAIQSNAPIKKDTVRSQACAYGKLEANIDSGEFMAKVAQAKEYIKSGDVLQVVLSRRLRAPFCGDPFDVYRKLRALNPSPYLYYLDFDEVKVAGSSPEMLVRVEGTTVSTCPIAGTRPRGADRESDLALAKELLGDAKERSEHLMLVDLGQDDLEKVCETGSVGLDRFMEVEKYSHVMHLVSSLCGNLAPGKNCFDALKACFPAGTVTGAPRARAMEIINELEPDGRGIYAGATGYIGFSGNMDFAITIRTIVMQEGYAYVQAGAGIVAGSNPKAEYEETVNKARALLTTLWEVEADWVSAYGQCEGL